MARDELGENINAAMELRKAGKTIYAMNEHLSEIEKAGPNSIGDRGAFVKEVVEAGQSEGETEDKE